MSDRLHVVPYVPHDQVVAFLSSADAGVIPIHHWPNHEIALITKYFEYAHARLPMIVSDVTDDGRDHPRVRAGEVFRAEDVEDFVRVVKIVMSDTERYRAAYDRPEFWRTGPGAPRRRYSTTSTRAFCRIIRPIRRIEPCAPPDQT